MKAPDSSLRMVSEKASYRKHFPEKNGLTLTLSIGWGMKLSRECYPQPVLYGLNAAVTMWPQPSKGKFLVSMPSLTAAYESSFKHVTIGQRRFPFYCTKGRLQRHLCIGMNQAGKVTDKQPSYLEKVLHGLKCVTGPWNTRLLSRWKSQICKFSFRWPTLWTGRLRY